MTPQKPAEGVMAFKDYPDMKMFRVPCECHCDNEIDVMVEVEDGIIQTSFDVDVKSHYWNEVWRVTYNELWFIQSLKHLVNTIHHRATVMWDVLVHGYVKSHATVLLTKQQTLNFSQTLIDAVSECEKQHAQLSKMVKGRKAKNAASKAKVLRPRVGQDK